MKKEDEDFFVGSGGKKKGKGKKNTPATNGAAPESGKLNMNIGIIEQLAKIGLDSPATQSDVPGVVDKLKEKLEEWKKSQDTQTKKVCQNPPLTILRLAHTSPMSPRRLATPKQLCLPYLIPFFRT